MDRIANELSRFNTDIQQFRGAYSMLVQDMTEVTDNMSALQNSWTGEAHDALMESFEQDRQKMQNMIDNMKQILDDLDYANNEYNNCENQVADLVYQIQV